ncbi:hypothetical protein EJP67_28965 [Variovorax guangxiensis]|uniref:Uncharacterized protein n=1 Tax=Variovorax guangxiensis TaxID=1775474 RepID=A0A433MTA0_9BURK|nr:hypothetical protein [Variovorax guangxiensis]RUR71093.1 hypothetical protein EJP67_28965 [Variovorax guangxiensis]
MDAPYEPPIEPLTEDWKKDKASVIKLAETRTQASEYFKLVQAVELLFNRYAPGAVSRLGYPQRIGLSRKVHDELYPVAHFASLHYKSSEDVWIQWRSGSQRFDATVEDSRPVQQMPIIHFLEVTTLQDEQDAKKLQDLNVTGTLSFISSAPPSLVSHQRKVNLLREVLGKKAEINYPPNTALLVYADEHRFAQYCFGGPAPNIDREADYGKVLKEMRERLLAKFEAVYVYSREQIYCWLRKGEAEHGSS